MKRLPRRTRPPGKVAWVGRIRRQLALYQRILRHPDTPRAARWLLGLAVAYLLNPFDLIPDWIPVLGQLDDLILVPLLVLSAMALVPKQVVESCRSAEDGVGDRE
jgi:uncharacterized membrane protein YkvA (DUF1232 family)